MTRLSNASTYNKHPFVIWTRELTQRTSVVGAFVRDAFSHDAFVHRVFVVSNATIANNGGVSLIF